MSSNPGNWYKLDRFLHTTFVVITVPNVTVPIVCLIIPKIKGNKAWPISFLQKRR